MRDNVKIGLIQDQAGIGETEVNLQKIAKAADDARKEDVDIISFGEGFVQGFVCTDQTKRLAQPIPGHATERLTTISKDTGCSIVTGLLENADGILHISTVFVERNGALHVYRKSFLDKLEKPFFQRGTKRIVVDTDFGKIGLMTCYDAFFPEVSRELGEKGAEIVFCNAATAISEKEFSIFLPARAAENQFYVAFTNLVGWREQIRAPYFGGSRIIGPDGTTIITAERFIADAVYATISDKFLRDARERKPLLTEVREQYKS
ncbi:MAG: carbon-nitrogen hydrolase family protein [Candidatus Bathyarchaeia archaeon]|jgi:predicted amidohydrolase